MKSTVSLARNKLAHRAQAQTRMLGAQAARTIRPLWLANVVSPAITAALKIRHDAAPSNAGPTGNGIALWITQHQSVVQTRATQLARAQGLPIDPKQTSPRVQAAIDTSRANYLNFFDDAESDLKSDLQATVLAPENLGLRVEEVRDLLLDRGNVSASRAELIARDQTYKLNAAVIRAHHEDSGVNSYTWSSSLDERVRPLHQDYEGNQYSYDNPPEDGNPGEPVNCRCVALPVFSDDDD